jgi:hypothetical protein
MKHFTKTLVVAALFAGTGAAQASIATGANAEAFLQVYDKSQGLTYDLDLGSVATLVTLAGSPTLHYDLSADSKWLSFASAMDPASTKYGVVVGNTLKGMWTSASVPNPPIGSAFTAITNAIKNQAGSINIGSDLANTAENLSKLVSDADTAKTGQWAAFTGGQNPLTTLYGTYGNADAAIAYGVAGNFYYEVASAGKVTTTLLANQWTLAGNSLDFAAPAAVPLPAAVWMFGAGLMGYLGLNRRKSVA